MSTAAFLAASLLAAAPAFGLDFLYLAANEGGSSGGHVALRIDRHVFHFVRDAPGIVRLRREDAEGFARRVRLLENRSIRVTRLDVNDGRAAHVRDVFTAHWIAEERRLANLRALEDERRLLEAVIAGRAGDASEPIALAGPGYFIERDDRGPEAAGTEPALARLRTIVGRARGADFLASRLAATHDALATLAPPTHDADDTDPPRRRRGFAGQYADLVVRARALEILAEARPLRPQTLHATALVLTRAERTALRTFSRRAEERVLALLDSPHPDAGFVLVVTLARLAAIERSLRTNRWVVLDTFPDDAPVLEPARVARHHTALVGAVHANGRDLAHARHRFVKALGRVEALPDAQLGSVEQAANQLLEAERSLAESRGLRVAAGPFVPARAMGHVHPTLPWPDPVLHGALAATRTAERAERAAIDIRHGYDLVRRNCVTELWRALAEAGVRAKAAGPLDFVPIVASTRAARRFSVRTSRELPSRRETAVAALREREHRVLVALRESNTLTATSYRRNADDSLFLFFTDGPAIVRPLLGVANLGATLAASLAGVAAAPFDGGHLLSAGLRGALFSLPEVAFVNVRKGTYDHVPERQLPGAVFPR